MNQARHELLVVVMDKIVEVAGKDGTMNLSGQQEEKEFEHEVSPELSEDCTLFKVLRTFCRKLYARKF